MNQFAYNILVCRVMTKVQLPRQVFFSLWFCDNGPLDGKVIKLNNRVTSCTEGKTQLCELVTIEDEKPVPASELYEGFQCCQACQINQSDEVVHVPWISI